MWGRAALVGAMICAHGCGEEPRSATWSFRIDDPALAARVVVVEARILEGGCGGAEVFSTLVGLDTLSETPGPLAPGEYGLAGRARDIDCVWFADGCTPVTLPQPAGADFEVQLTASVVEEPQCEGECSAGACPMPDAGAPDAGEGDAGSDAGDSDGGPTDAGPGDAGPPRDAGACPPGYTQMGRSCYRVELTRRTWIDGELDCESDGAHLIVVDDVDEHSLLHSLSVGAPFSWVGYTDRAVEGTFQWVAPPGVDPLSNRCFWGTGPMNAGILDCAAQQTDNMCEDWFLLDCTGTQAYVCEYDGRTADPSSY